MQRKSNSFYKKGKTTMVEDFDVEGKIDMEFCIIAFHNFS